MTKLRHLAAVVLLTFSSIAAQAQGEKSNWYFGKGAGIIFKGDSAVAANSRLFTEEGSATMSDAAGNLLLYTNGITVWNGDHRVMPNGNGLMGGKSSTQSALILPKPGSNNIYYIFTTDIQAQSNGLRYSVVDMGKQEGKGDIVSRNNFMIAPATEKLTAVRHSNGRDWWVLAHRWNSNGYMAFLVNEQGVEVRPVLSMVGTVHGGANRKAIGYLVPSPDGTRLAAALWDADSNFEILNFDRSTGKVSDPVLLKGFEEAYGVLFSPDGTKLYGTANGTGGGKAQIVQFDLKAGNADAIAKSATVIGTSKSPRIGALQLGPDGKIYVARQDNYYLGVINNPNAKGAAVNYVDDGFHLGKQRSDLGLPNFPQGLGQ
ncbi:WD40 repeat protein [Pontibacter ummariensis]|uniref:WD40-like Beta Propeller Repeat n=1 Tax=Pontibacter ummariensis TaxID=1610492 RepID=A0A239BD96_9BACT|nr:PD40 domain-containing protein [Pontibacter ummariensis]PRY16468.1 WD40 repeat protein [Pontibacter ummariensis]SNS05699.1 WD40-like Beta Propeller Repeat [Pontibacter ummariensis]